MKHVLIMIFAGTQLLAGCANVINTAASDYYIDSCVSAEEEARLLYVEAICSRAIVSADWSKRKPEMKSQRLYNLGRIKRQLRKFPVAIQLFKESLAIEEVLPNRSDLRIGLRLIELSSSLAGLGRWDEGMPDLERALPVVQQFTEAERTFAAKVFNQYVEYFRKMNQVDVAERLENAAAVLQ